MNNDLPPNYVEIKKSPQIDRLLNNEPLNPPSYGSLFKKTVDELKDYQKSS